MPEAALGSLTAIDLARGEIRWRAVLGEFPELKARGVPKTGTPNLGGSIVTAGGLVFVAATNDSRFRAFDKDTGEELWSVELPASGHATPMTYLGRSGRQYVAIAAGGGNEYNRTFAAKLLVFARPRGGAARPLVTRAAPAMRQYTGIKEDLPGPPVPVSHRRHASVACSGCHPTSAAAERAGLPDAAKCASCHAGRYAEAVTWTRVYKLPEYVVFSHARHAPTECPACHGPVARRDALRKEVSTSMVACMDCHKRAQASTACDVCHQLGQ